MNNSKPHILLIAGTGQNVGKTLLACKLFESISQNMEVMGVKISPHFHKLSEKEHVVVKNENYVITEEFNKNTGKDSARMLNAGASRVFYIQVHDEHLEKAMAELWKILPPDTPIICESGGLRKLINPGVFLMVHRKGNLIFKPQARLLKPLADECLEFNGKSFNWNPDNLIYTIKGWKIKKTVKTHTI